MKHLILRNLLTDKEIQSLKDGIDTYHWTMSGTSDYDDNKPSFWFKDIIKLNFHPILNRHLSKILRVDISKIICDRIYLNGQAHGQCGYWHRDKKESFVGTFLTLVYWFDEKWKPEYGGHLLIKDNDVSSILPEYNMGVLFDSKLLHMGLEPTTHCKSQRISLAYKFEVT